MWNTKAVIHYSENGFWKQFKTRTRKLFSIKDRGQTSHVLTLTCDLQFQSTASHGSDQHTCKKINAKGQSVRMRVEMDGETNKQTDGGNCMTSHANAESNYKVSDSENK